MAAIGGSIESIILNGRNFAVAADAESSRKLGGSENAVEANGNGTSRILKTIIPPGLGGLTVEVDDDRGDQEFLVELADLNDFFPVVITYASGVSYQGVAQIVDEAPVNSANATAALNLMGSGRFTRQ